jgi:hypothetical protein
MIEINFPILFGTPRRSKSILALGASIFCIIFAFILFLLNNLGGYSALIFQLSIVTLICHAVFAISTSAANILFIFRYFLIWSLPMFTALVWAAYGGSILVAPFGAQYQTEYNTVLICLAGIFGCAGTLMGWHLPFVFEKSMRSMEKNIYDFFLNRRSRRLMLISGIVLASAASLLYVANAGGTIGANKSYVDGNVGSNIEFGVFNVFHYLGIAAILLAGLREKDINPNYLFFAIATLFVGILAGSRADYLPQLLIICILFFNRDIVNSLASSKNISFQYVKWACIGIVILLIAYLTATFIAVWREGLPIWEVLNIIINSERVNLVNNIYGHDMLFIETGNMIIGGFYAAIENTNIDGYLMGSSYIDYLLKLPPAFLGFDRPIGLDQMTFVNGQIMAQGGIFELAEAYWNFGMLGCILVPVIISFIFASILKRGISLNSAFYLSWYLIFGFMGFRAVWYQNFSYVRQSSIMLLVWILSFLAFRWYIYGSRKFSHTYRKLTDIEELKVRTLI